MGIDYYTCFGCERAFPDVIAYHNCEECGNIYCSTKCAKPELIESVEDDSDEERTSCVYCRDEIITDTDILSAVLQHFNISKEEALELYKKSRE